MSLPWVKVRISLVDNDTFKALTPGAKLTFHTALLLAGKQKQNGKLYVRGVGPMSAKEIAGYTGMRLSMQQSALEELCIEERFFRLDLEGCYHVLQFDEVAGEESTRAANADRQRRHREKRRNDSNALSVTQKVTDKELDNYASLRSAAIGRYGVWPEDADGLAALGLLFLARFANCIDPEKSAKQIGAYASFLAGARREGYGVEQTWDACEKAWFAGGCRPLWAGTIARSRNFFPGRNQAAPARKSTYLERQGLKAVGS